MFLSPHPDPPAPQAHKWLYFSKASFKTESICRRQENQFLCVCFQCTAPYHRILHNTGLLRRSEGDDGCPTTRSPNASVCHTSILILLLNFASLLWSCECPDERVVGAGWYLQPGAVTWLDKGDWLAWTPLSVTALSPLPPNILFCLCLFCFSS